MSLHDSSKMVPVQITEDEGALYDRQIRLWGLEAQQKMRNATLLIVNLKGVATETIKNIVLAGIGKLIILDGENVKPEDLGAGFFLRDEDVGRKRVEAAKSRIGELNPLVTIEVLPEALGLLLEAEGGRLEEVVKGVDMVCATDVGRDDAIRINETCRKMGKPMYVGGSYGLLGFIFCDLLKHEYIAPDRSGTKENAKNTLASAQYCSLKGALTHRWAGMTRRQTKELNPAVVFTVLAIWEFQSLHQGKLPDDLSEADELENIANKLIKEADVNKQVLTVAPRDLIEMMSTTAFAEFSPVCAVVGGLLAQDILKALGAREAPLANFFTFDGNTGGGTVVRMKMAGP